MIKVIVNGAQGKMGSLACQAINHHPELDLVAGLTRADNLQEVIQDTQAQVVVDLTRADSVYANTLAIIENNAHPVIGTSGLQSHEIQRLAELSSQKQLGGIIVPNFSVAAVLMMRFAREAAKYLPDVEIIEAHHPQKYDAPSGTAIKTAEMIAAVRPAAKTWPSQEQYAGVRGGKCHDVPIHSLRLSGVLANQQVIFGNIGETLTLTHTSIDRNCFMSGLILCCLQVKHLKTLHYGMECLLI